jgi:hypothetical protein
MEYAQSATNGKELPIIISVPVFFRSVEIKKSGITLLIHSVTMRIRELLVKHLLNLFVVRITLKDTRGNNESYYL